MEKKTAVEAASDVTVYIERETNACVSFIDAFTFKTLILQKQ